MEQSEGRSTVLIDTDNVSPKYIKYILGEVNDQEITTYKHIYDDWTNNEKRSWENVLLNQSVNPIQQYSYTTGKNTTDSAMIIDVVDILYSGNVDGLCLVSSNSSSTKLVQRLREAGTFVMGIGEQKTPKPFRVACDIFKLLEITSSDDTPEAIVIGNQKTVTSIDEIQKAITKLLIEDSSQNQPIVLAQVGNFLTKRFSDFDVRNYGYSKLSAFLEGLDNNDFQVVKLHDGFFMQERNASISRAEVEKTVTRMIEESNGRMSNLSIVHDKLKRIFPSFDVKQYDFSHISSFIRSLGGFKIRDNMVQMR